MTAFLLPADTGWPITAFRINKVYVVVVNIILFFASARLLVGSQEHNFNTLGLIWKVQNLPIKISYTVKRFREYYVDENTSEGLLDTVYYHDLSDQKKYLNSLEQLVNFKNLVFL